MILYPMSRFPRFGYGSEFSKLASSEQEEQTDYVVGILAVSFFITSLFIFWAAVIITCKCMGKRRVGLCAGRVLVKCDEKGQFRPPPYVWKLRCTFILFGCCMFGLCMTLVGPGLASIKTTSVTIRKLSRDVDDLMTQGLVILDSVERVKRNIDGLDVQSMLKAGEACPTLKDMNEILSASSIQDIDEKFDRLKEQIQNTDLEKIRQHIDLIMDGTEHIETAATTFEENDWIVKMFVLFLGVLVFFMIFAACSAWSGRCQSLSALTCTSEFIFLPTFVLAIVCCWIATSALAFVSISNADFCSGNSQQSGPAGTVTAIFEERGITSNDMIFTAFTYYQSGCATDDPIIQLYEYEDYLQSGIGSADQFLAKVNEVGVNEINDKCGGDITSFIEGIELISDNLGLLLDALRSTFELASCSTMGPIITQAFEDVACTDSHGTFALLSTIAFAMSLVGMIMVMLRAGMYPYQKLYYPTEILGNPDFVTNEEALHPSAPSQTTSFHRANPSIRSFEDVESEQLSPPDSKFPTISVSNTGKALSESTRRIARSNSHFTLSTLCSNDFAPDDEDRSPMTPRKLW
ncbi:hypothetical protein ACHAW5_005867 [Stephanodiscus triporus]|uniref:Protein tweety homolog n=1 Tax=Stephanodiscus triporus TaxID=2934178 RepID=A0ABD3QWE6_9STRA